MKRNPSIRHVIPIWDPKVHIMLCIRKRLEEWDFHYIVPFWRLYWNTTPGAFVYSKKEGVEHRVALGPDRLVLIPAHADYESRLPEPPALQYYIHFSLNAPEANHHLDGRALAIPLDATLEALLQRIVEKEEETAPLQLVLEVLSRLPAGDLRQEKISARIDAAKAYLLERMGEKVSLAELGRHVGMNPNAFSRLFKKATGWTPHAWLSRARIDEAEHLLEHSELSIEAIAERLGFYDRYHFSRQFYYQRGLYPAKQRRLKAAPSPAP